LKKILIANRGEIAVRIIRTCREMSVSSVAVYSECDRTALHVCLADEAYAIGKDQPSESYLRIDKLIDAARRSKADAIHPGYGFLAENAEFADACRKAGLTFIGPSPRAMATMGSKTGARQIAVGAGVPVVPGSELPIDGATPDDALAKAAATIGYPLLVKAVAGGGGKGMRVVRSEPELLSAVQLARSEAKSAFGSDEVYFERLIDHPRHIEVQLLGDEHGTVWPFVERECSIQRRHQKIVEETPSPSVSAELRAKLTQAAAEIGRAARYASAGTIEFLVDGDGRHFFLEMNTRLQVEHPITEAVTGVDFVRAQIEIARGKTLADAVGRALNTEPGADGFVPARGHAIECRVYAEDPDEGFLPSPGSITHLRAPSGPGIRDDSGAVAGSTVPTFYDSLISKVIAWAPDRRGAVSRMIRALNEYDVRGIKTTIGFCRELLSSIEFRDGNFDTTTVDRIIERRRPADTSEVVEELAAIAAALATDTEPAAPVDAPAVVQPKPAREKPLAESLWAQRARFENLRG
jgi:acetyl-CoA carboxylase biotin carboxylase subunit